MKRCFVISPIGPEGSKTREHSNSVLARIIMPVIEERGLSAYRSDQLHESGRITDQMFEAILNADFCLAVLTGRNPNVFYELAIAQAAGKPVVMLMEKGPKVPFDIQDFRCVRYDLNADLDACKLELSNHIRSLEEQNWTSEGLLERYRKKKKHGVYFVLFPSLRNDPFYLQLLAGISSSPVADRDMSLAAPSDAYSGTQFLEALNGLLARQGEFVGGLIAPTLEDVAAEDLTDCINRFKIPLVLVDINPYGEAPLPRHICYVGFDNRSGGTQAATAIATALGPDLHDKRVLVLANKDQPDRHKGFQDAWDGTIRPVLEFCDFNRADAREKTERAMSRVAAEFHGVFGVSDEIALGAVQAVCARRHNTVVIGFDGSSAATFLIDLKNTPLINTVVQDPYKMGEKAIAILKRQMASEAVTKQREILPVEMYVDFLQSLSQTADALWPGGRIR